MHQPQVTAFRWVPAFAQGLVRDLRVRWALEEAGQGYQEHLIGPAQQQSSDYRQQQPFGQVPVLKDDEQTIFESGAIVLHIAEQTTALMPSDPALATQVKTWMFAALNTIEPPIMMLNVIDMQPPAIAQAAHELRANVAGMIGVRLNSLAAFLGNREYLAADRFTSADLLMTTVLRILRTTDLLATVPSLDAYKSRNEARPAFQKALAAQMDTFERHAPQQ
jgi:glutathione S-transferase